ncbi:phosphate metabolism protein 7 [Exophiala xenobiotica]|nr:phosphate metabolism protein 7 [Exophiala xenobiotica]KAK5392881.1 phosphate metabolism protein 7 [Exophiala xenobiotica]KAK5411936.1 phosphate metabolism protein 7 [Exophiala xenobiotica]KAK5460507.1 phosphate metabolism protein 7 [Exophiala xenobiotica]KAK5481191.1 phosphate metabolism protein 7 [Exophiala xenobiotica]
MSAMEAFHAILEIRAEAPSTNTSNDQNIGSARQGSPSLSGLISTLVPTLIIAVLYFALFLLLRSRFPRQYAPRTYLGALRPQERTPAPPNTLFGWIPFMRKVGGIPPIEEIKVPDKNTNISSQTSGGGQKQLNLLSFSNVQDKRRYYAHVFVSWVFIGFIFFLVTREMVYYINLRQAYLLSPLYASRISSRTVLFQSVPTEYADEAKIRRMFGDELKNVWIASDAKELEERVSERYKLCIKLETAETKLIKLANDAYLKTMKGKSTDAERPAHNHEDYEAESGAAAGRWVKPEDRPTHRLKPLIGKKVDTINWCREEIGRLNPLIEAEQTKYRSGESTPRNAVFVEFWSQVQAQSAFQMVTHHQVLHMSPRVVGLSPEEIVWSNLGITWKTRTIRNIISLAFVTALIIFWSIPVAVVGSISQISYLTEVAPFLDFINDCPKVILGVITNLLPTIMLSILISLVPVILRFMGKVAGKPTLSLIELRCHESFFWFQIVQVFLVTTMTSAASAAVPQVIKNPGSITSILAKNLPLASNFYISYFILQGLVFSSGQLLQIVGLILFNVMSRVLDKTPRKMYNRWSSLSSVGWGSVFPIMEMMTVISITYSPIAPLMMGFATLGLGLFYFAYRYNLLFVDSSVIDTKGLVYSKALQHTLVGCYLAVICMIGLLGIRAAPGPLVLMIIFLVFMILYHISLTTAVRPLLHYLPRSLESEEAALLRDDSLGMSSPDNRGKSSFEKNPADELRRARNSSTRSDGNKKPVSILKRFLRPDIYASYAVMRKLVPQDFAEIRYSPEVERDAYQDPAVNAIAPLLWVPHDEVGVSRQECFHTNKVVPMTDEGAYFNEKGRIVWDEEETGGRPPIFEEKIYY